jgi:hypothetical protein
MIRKLKGTLVVSVTLILSGCGYIFPGFEGLFGIHSYIHDIPVGRITTELQCELASFLMWKDESGKLKYPDILDPKKTAAVTIKFQTDQSGTFQYVGVDLSKFGLANLANLITTSSKTPSLQAKIQGKTTASSQLDLAIAQTWGDSGDIKPDPSDPNPKHYHIPGLHNAKPCNDPSRGMLGSLSLASWLGRFFDRLSLQGVGFDAQPAWKAACLSKITLNTQIVLLLDVSAGVNPLIASTFILPVSGETFDYNPSATQSLQIVLQLNTSGNNACRAPSAQANRTI